MMDNTAARELDYGITVSVQALIKAMGMQAANNQHSQNQPYTQKDFDSIIEDLGIHHNAILSRWEGI
jgi:hypothetical protein